ncbi:MAG: Ni/Fe-hydrogenase, b-type cytochrome subunit [Desulfobulbaceae bacterium]|nr:Ni/Fe-hydrogenase, b-type cytochrome subunit [Desulfobulbaceae bacterium]
MNYEKKYVWSVLFRLFHWAFVLSIVVLAVTGFYINDPWPNPWLAGSRGFPMADMRYYHFLAGYVFTAALLVRLFLYLFGNRHERILHALPVTPGKVKNIFTTMAYYGYVTDRHGEDLGHNTIAGIVYLFTYVAAAAQVVGGFYLLYPESAGWQAWGLKFFGTQQQARHMHHLLLWYFLFFALVHLYLVVWNDVKAPEGMISSIFNGYKFKPKHNGSAEG